MAAVLTPKERVLWENTKAIGALPWLFDIHGIGFMLHGDALRDPDISDEKFVRAHWVTLTYVPVIPLGVYLISHPKKKNGPPDKRKIIVHRSVTLKGVRGVWGWRGLVWLFASAWAVALGVFAIGVAIVGIGSLLGFWRV